MNTDVRSFPKARLMRAPFESGSGRCGVKVEITTYETSPARPHHRTPHRRGETSLGAEALLEIV